ncbi:MAG: D-alanyl-D-alanine carboxypeptidase [Alphaproteobacteria bacterium]
MAGPALVIEPKSGLVLYAEDPDALWHPASLTKLMTAYLTFEALRKGELTLEDKVTSSAHALKQPPSKIGLPVGHQITVDKALKALIVKSANDVAVMLAEKIGGTEAAFVRQMNATAKRLGMTRTHFNNANGLPDDKQITTARDLAILARMLLKEYPQHAYLYSLPQVKFGKRVIRSHNRLLKTFEGADGMKTGFICDSGYNVVASARRGGKQIVAVVLGARSGRARTARAAALIEHGFKTYMWKTMFSTPLDQMKRSAHASNTPGKMREIVCRVRKRHRKRRHRRHRRKKHKHHKKASKNAGKKK